MNNLSLNPDKIQFKSTDCKFFEHRLTPEGLKPDPEKIKAILAMQPPQSIQLLQSFNGMVDYLKRFSPVLSELAEPLRKLQKSDTVWAWESEQQTAFEKTKTALTTLLVLAYFDKNKDHIIQTDASKTGLSAVLLQEGQPIVYAVIFPDWVGEIHTAQSQQLNRRQRTRISNILSLIFYSNNNIDPWI